MSRVEEWEPYKWCVLTEVVVFSALILGFFDRLTGGALKSFPPPFGQVFLAGLVFTAGLSLFGITRRRTVRGALYEQSGQIGFAMLLMTYGIWSLAALGAPATGFFGMILSRSVAAILTVIKIEVIKRRAVHHGGSP